MEYAVVSDIMGRSPSMDVLLDPRRGMIILKNPAGGEIDLPVKGLARTPSGAIAGISDQGERFVIEPRGDAWILVTGSRLQYT